MGTCFSSSSPKPDVQEIYLKYKMLAKSARKRQRSNCEHWQDHSALGGLEMLREVGRGGYAAVHLARHTKTGKFSAVKVVSLNRYDITDIQKKVLENETRFLPMLEHPHVVGCSLVLESSKHLVIVLEYLPGGALLDRLARKQEYTEAFVCRVFVQVLQAVHYCHMLGIAHRDIKPENIMFGGSIEDAADYEAELPAKLIDFGMATLIRQGQGQGQLIRGCVGSPGFIAPEVICNKPHSLAMDIWSLGAVLFVMLTGRLPFSKVDTSTLQYASKSIADAPGLLDDNYVRLSCNAKSILMAMLSDDPTARPSAAQLLQHPWVKEQGSGVQITSQADAIRKRFASMAANRWSKGWAATLNIAPRPGAVAVDFEALKQAAREARVQSMRRVGTLSASTAAGIELALALDEQEQDEHDGFDERISASAAGATHRTDSATTVASITTSAFARTTRTTRSSACSAGQRTSAGTTASASPRGGSSCYSVVYGVGAAATGGDEADAEMAEGGGASGLARAHTLAVTTSCPLKLGKSETMETAAAVAALPRAMSHAPVLVENMTFCRR